MTPQEISDYKMRWAPGFTVGVHSDLDVRCKDWCRKNLERQQWGMESYTDVYEHTFRFEKQSDANQFSTAFKEWLT